MKFTFNKLRIWIEASMGNFYVQTRYSIDFYKAVLRNICRGKVCLHSPNPCFYGENNKKKFMSTPDLIEKHHRRPVNGTIRTFCVNGREIFPWWSRGDFILLWKRRRFDHENSCLVRCFTIFGKILLAVTAVHVKSRRRVYRGVKRVLNFPHSSVAKTRVRSFINVRCKKIIMK